GSPSVIALPRGTPLIWLKVVLLSKCEAIHRKTPVRLLSLNYVCPVPTLTAKSPSEIED
ncbi:hypothetical protein J6590_073840, partial [Homalodisca vitripennis]